MKHINYFDLGLWKFPHEIELMLNTVLPQFVNSYSIYGFEAHPVYAAEIKERYKQNPNIHIFNLAISNKKGTEKLYISEPVDIGSSIFSTKRNVNPNNYHEVESNTFSGWLQENNIVLDGAINILKVNIEGAELYLWEDFKNTGLRDKFQILCGHPAHDILKVEELKDKTDYYFSLLKELDISLLRFCGECFPENNINMGDTIRWHL